MLCEDEFGHALFCDGLRRGALVAHRDLADLANADVGSGEHRGGRHSRGRCAGLVSRTHQAY